MSKRRTLKEIRRLLLTTFKNQNISIRELSMQSGIDWYTVERQLTYLKGMELVDEVFRHKFLRLFHLTDTGREVVDALQKKKTMLNQDIKNFIKRKL